MDAIRKNWIFSFMVAILIGVALYYGERLLTYLLSPFVLTFANHFLTPSPEAGFGTLIAFNFFLTLLAAVLVSILAVLLIRYILRYESMLYPFLACLGFLVASYWWFLIDVMGAVANIPTDGMIVLLSRPLIVGGVFLIIARLLVLETSPNKSSMDVPVKGSEPIIHHTQQD